MTLVVPPGPNSTVNETADGLRIVIPSRKAWFQIIFLGAWLVGWAYGEIFALSIVFSGITTGSADLFITAWLVLWTVAGAKIIGTFFWSLTGREMVVIGGSRLTVRNEIFGLGRSRDYLLSNVRRLRADSQWSGTREQQAALSNWSGSGGMVAFDYGPSTVYFGQGIDEAEAMQLLEKIQSRVPSLVAASN